MQLREYQSDTIERLRDGFRAGHRRQILSASTGAGKSVIMMEMVRAATEKKTKTIFICERRNLVDQFSAHLDREGIDHGILMAGSWRFRPQEYVQIASAQTLERMESWPDFTLAFVDEIHASMRKSIINMFETRESLRVVGATATPFHELLPKYFSNVVSAPSMENLVNMGFLVPYRVFVAKEVDTRGVHIVAGEWQKDELEDRGRKIVGDIVADYLRLSNDILGRKSKAICFSCGIAHGTELEQSFQDAGINAVQLASGVDEQYKSDALREFARENSSIDMLISVDMLSRGFDQTDIEHVILSRPLKRSFSQHVQMIGRGARSHEGKEFCLARGTMVLTDQGDVRIEDVTLDHKVWDGVMYVKHAGAVCNGLRDVIEYDGVIATPEHEVMTHEGWKTIKTAASRRLRIARTGVAGYPVRLSDYLLSHSTWIGGFTSGGSAMLALFRKTLRTFSQHSEATRNCRLPALQCTTSGTCSEMALSTMPSSDESMSEYKIRFIRTIRSAWHRISFYFRKSCGNVGSGEYWDSGLHLSTGQDRQQRSLRAGKSSMGNSCHEHEQYTGFWWARKVYSIQKAISISKIFGLYSDKANTDNDTRRDSQEMGTSVMQTEREVWDILNAGPLQRFTANGRLVHNCVIQDHTNNFLRFREEWEAFYSNGVQKLSAEVDKKPKKEPTELEKKQAKCPVCGALWPGNTDTCVHCGHTREKRNTVTEVPGEMLELTATKSEKYDSAIKEQWYRELLGYARSHGKKDGFAFYKYQEKFGVKPPWRKVTAAPSYEVEQWIRSRNIAWSKSQKRV